jgi:hypothetical protein
MIQTKKKERRKSPERVLVGLKAGGMARVNMLNIENRKV